MWMIRKTFFKYTSIILSYIFPVTCYLCHKESKPICISCLSRLKKSIDTPAPYIVSIYSFKDPHVKKIIHEIKKLRNI